MPGFTTPCGRGPGSVIPNASTFILSGPHAGRVPSWHRAGTPPGHRANSVVRATIRSTQPITTDPSVDRVLRVPHGCRRRNGRERIGPTTQGKDFSDFVVTGALTHHIEC